MAGWGSRLALAVLLLVGGCAQAPVRVEPASLTELEPVTRFRLDGRLSVKSEAQSFSGSLSWRRAGTEETLLLSGPLGQGAVEIRRQGALVVLKAADGTTVTEADDERLMERAVGLRLPLQGLVYWLSALPTPARFFRADADGDGRVVGLDQDGWHIEYSRYEERGGRWLPGRIFARRGEIEFRLVVDVWEPL
jgi:outer membrane lipoprotein LolB